MFTIFVDDWANSQSLNLLSHFNDDNSHGLCRPVLHFNISSLVYSFKSLVRYYQFLFQIQLCEWNQIHWNSSEFSFRAWRNLFFSCLSRCLYTPAPANVTVGQGCPREIPRWRTDEVNWDRDVLETPCYRNQGHPPLHPHCDHTTRFLGLLDQVVAETGLQRFICRILVGFGHIGTSWFHRCTLWSRDLVFTVLQQMAFLMKKFHHWLQYLKQHKHKIVRYVVILKETELCCGWSDMYHGNSCNIQSLSKNTLVSGDLTINNLNTIWKQVTTASWHYHYGQHLDCRTQRHTKHSGVCWVVT